MHGEKYLNFVVTPRNFIIAKLSIRKHGSSLVLIISPGLRIESFAIIKLRGVTTKFKYVFLCSVTEFYISHHAYHTMLCYTIPYCQRRRKQSRAGGEDNISKKGTLFYFDKQAEKPNFKK